MLEVLDTAGQEEYTTLRTQWIRHNQGFILVYSITSTESFARVQRFHDEILRVKGSLTSTSDPGALTYAVMLVGNKSDRTERAVSYSDGLALAEELGCRFVETSAKTPKNVEKAFYDVVCSLRRADPLNGGESQLEIGVKTRRGRRQCVIL